jgi:tRNA-splicing ligase RtcB
MRLIEGVPVFGEIDGGALEQIRRTALGAQHVALMADHHKGYGVPIGGVAAYADAISPTGVGYDIACGNKAVLTDMVRDDLNQPWRRTPGVASWGVQSAMDLIFENISFGMGRRNAEPVDHELFDDPAWQLPAYRALRDKAAAQLGTVGSGNHYVDLLVDELDRVWIGVHFGSRGFGHGVATHTLKVAGARDDMDAEPLVLSVHSTLGAEYLAGMELAGRYAYAGRDWVCAKVAKLLGARILEEVHNHHNFAWFERGHAIGGYMLDLWVVRKGATPAYPGQRGFVGGSMGDVSVILEGTDTAAMVDADTARDILMDQQAALFSTVHGAGRVMSRTAAAGKRNRKTGEVLKPGAITPEMMREWLAREGVELRGGGLDEAPQAYRRLPDVLRAQGDTVRVLQTLRPIGVAMAGPDIRDPYAD